MYLSLLLQPAIASGAYEKVCVLFNIAALQSQIASAQNHENNEGLKLTVKLFQVSDGWLVLLILPYVFFNLRQYTEFSHYAEIFLMRSMGGYRWIYGDNHVQWKIIHKSKQRKHFVCHRVWRRNQIIKSQSVFGIAVQCCYWEPTSWLSGHTHSCSLSTSLFLQKNCCKV